MSFQGSLADRDRVGSMNIGFRLLRGMPDFTFEVAGPMDDESEASEIFEEYPNVSSVIRTPNTSTAVKDFFNGLNLEKLKSYDIVHIHANNSAPSKYIKRFLLDNGIKTVITLHTPFDISPTFYRYDGEHWKNLMTECKNIRLVSPSLTHRSRTLRALNLSEEDAINLSCIYNGVEIEEITPIQGYEDRIIVIGRLDRSKNIKDALECCIDNGHRCVYVGKEWNSTPKMEFYIEETKSFIADHFEDIIWIKEIPNKMMIPIIAGCKLHLNLSEIESCSTSVIESTIAGTPIVGYGNDTGVSELIIDGVTGKLLDKKDYFKKPWRTKKRLLGQVINDALNSINDRETIQSIGRERFNSVRMVNEYINLYDELIKEMK